MEFNEKDIKKRLVKKLNQLPNIQVYENPSMIFNFDGEDKEVRPDLICNITDSLYFVIEIKDDKTKSFKLTNLLRQATIYRFSKYHGKNPLFVLIATQTSLLESNCFYGHNEVSFANKLQIGILRTSANNSTGNKKLSAIIGSNVLWLSEEVEEVNNIGDINIFNFLNKFKLNIGTTARSNKRENSALTEFVDSMTVTDEQMGL